MFNSVKAVGLEVLRNVPRGAGMALGAAITAATLAGLAQVLNKGSEAIKEKTGKKLDKVVAEHTPQAQAAA